jgi:hypothetical protein
MTAELSAEDLLVGARLRHRVTVPPELLADEARRPGDTAEVVLRPLSVMDLQAIAKAARDDTTLSSALMIQRAMVSPELDQEQTLKLPAGLARFLVDRVNELSGLAMTADTLAEHVQAPLARACFILAKKFGWTPEEVSGMTVGQILLYVQMARGEASDGA